MTQEEDTGSIMTNYGTLRTLLMKIAESCSQAEQSSLDQSWTKSESLTRSNVNR